MFADFSNTMGHDNGGGGGGGLYKMMSSYGSFGFCLTRILKANRTFLKVYKALCPSRKTKEKEGYFLLNICSYLSLPLLLSTVDQTVCTM